jgi:hypothetical protein
VAAQLTDENVVLFPMPGENSETIRSVPGQSIHETHSCVEPDTPLIQEIRPLTTCASFLNFSVAGIVAEPCYPLEKIEAAKRVDYRLRLASCLLCLTDWEGQVYRQPSERGESMIPGDVSR